MNCYRYWISTWSPIRLVDRRRHAEDRQISVVACLLSAPTCIGRQRACSLPTRAHNYIHTHTHTHIKHTWLLGYNADITRSQHTYCHSPAWFAVSNFLRFSAVVSMLPVFIFLVQLFPFLLGTSHNRIKIMASTNDLFLLRNIILGIQSFL